MSSSIEMKKKVASLRLDSELYSSIEKLAKQENRSVNNFIEKVLSDAVNFKIPNAETVQAIKEMNKEKVILKRYSSGKELLEDLEDR